MKAIQAARAALRNDHVLVEEASSLVEQLKEISESPVQVDVGNPNIK